MFIHFIFSDGSNPYIAKTPKEAFRLFCKYETDQVSELTFKVLGLNDSRPHTYKEYQDLIRNIAIFWQYDFEKFNYSYSDLSVYQEFFEDIGRKYGLIREFRENAII